MNGIVASQIIAATAHSLTCRFGMNFGLQRVIGFNFGMRLFGTISFTFWMVGSNGLGGFTGLTWSRFRWLSVPGKALYRSRRSSAFLPLAA